MSSKKNKLERMILRLPEGYLKLPRDENGRYLPYCDFGFHPGIILNEEFCFRYGCECKHYHKLYIPKKD